MIRAIVTLLVLTERLCTGEASGPCAGDEVLVVVSPRSLWGRAVAPCLLGPATWCRTVCPDPCAWPDTDDDLDVDLADLAVLLAGAAQVEPEPPAEATVEEPPRRKPEERK